MTLRGLVSPSEKNNEKNKPLSIADRICYDKQMSQLAAFINQLNSNQQQAVVHETGPAVVLAGAGSGKTRVLTTHAAWLVQDQNISPDSILLVTFTNKAAGEMNQRIQELTNNQLPYSGTFHGFCARLLRHHGKAVGLEPNYLIYDSSDQTTLLRQVVNELEINTQHFKPNAIKAMISTAKNNLIDVDEFAQQAENKYQQAAARVYRRYQHQLLEQNAVDFDDLLQHTITLLTHHPQVLEKLQNQFVHVLVDEYQDTNKAQYQLTKLLAQPQDNVYVVGDFAQSIYAWRGADYRNLLHLKQDFKQLTEYKLEQNYRSTQPILQAATKLISSNTTHPVLKLWTNNKTGEPITLIKANSGEAEAQAVITKIQQLNRKNQYQYQDFAILYRTNAQSRAFEEFFIKAGIPYQIIGGFKFYERAEIKDVLAYLRLAVNQADSVSEERALKLGKRRFLKFQNWLQKHLQKQKLPAAGKTNHSLSPYELLEQILKATKYLEKYDAKNEEDLDRIENIRELLSVASQFDDVILFLENVSLVQDEQLKDLPPAEANNRVSLLSLHSAKGLEFPVVFIVGVEEGLLPHSHSLFDQEKLEEERRLCYVGITRAKERLFLSFAETRWLYGRSGQCKPSRFLSQLPERLLVQREHEYHFKNQREPYYNHWSKKGGQSPSAPTKGKSGKKYRLGIEVSEEELDQLLDGEIDVEDFLRG